MKKKRFPHPPKKQTRILLPPFSGVFLFSLAFWKNLCYNEVAVQLNKQAKNGVHFYFDKNVCSFDVCRFCLCVYSVVPQQSELHFLCVASAAHFLFMKLKQRYFPLHFGKICATMKLQHKYIFFCRIAHIFSDKNVRSLSVRFAITVLVLQQSELHFLRVASAAHFFILRGRTKWSFCKVAGKAL